jgi:hypothetical protein
MKKFLALYNMPTEAFEAFADMSDEDKKKEMEEWTTWMEDKKGSLSDMGNPVGNNKRMTKEGVSEERNEVGGYSIVEAESHEAACELLADNPHFKVAGAYIEVMEIIEM